MNIALIGYGKMGKAIEQIALDKGHNIVLRINDQNLHEFTAENLKKADVAIEFTGPHTALGNLRTLLSWQIPVVCGSTGWTSELDSIHHLCSETNGSFLYASNFSVGVNIFFELNKKLAQLMAPHAGYEVSLEEIHHTQKLDAPSGTAITLAEQVLENLGRKSQWVNAASNNAGDLVIISKREDPAPGTHSVRYQSAIDDIEIIHTAHNRQGFASGAVLAAEYIYNKKGIFSMKDVLGL